jgi:hypothetical protein
MRSTIRAEIAGMKAKGDVRATPADAPKVTLDEAFWESARIVTASSSGASSIGLQRTWPGGGLEEIGEEILVDVAGEEARQFSAEPVCEAAGKFFFLARLKAVQNERAEEDLAPCVVGALLFAQSRLERLLLGFELGESRAKCWVLSVSASGG